MIHLGDITKIKGYEVPVVDCLVGGSPCQDLSVAGLRKGLAGKRSGLFMEQIRIIKEMREHDRANGRTGVDVRCRYGIWENVPGALSSPGKEHAGKDFAAVLEEFIRVSEPEAPSISVPKKGWPTSGCIIDEMGNWSVAWRVMDAQYWGVPQRRKRICLVADFNGLNAPKIVFGEAEYNGSTEQTGEKSSIGNLRNQSRSKVQAVTEGLSGNSDSCESQRKETAGDVADGLGGAVKSVGFPLGFRPENVRCYDEVATTLCNGTRPGFTTGVIQQVISVDQGGGKSGANSYEGVSPTLTCTHGGEPAVAYEMEPIPIHDQATRFSGKRGDRSDGKGNGFGVGNPGDPMNTLTGGDRHAVAYSVENHLCIEMTSTKNTIITDGICPTLTARMGTGGNQVNAVMEPVGYEMQAFGKYKDSGIASALKARDYKDATALVVQHIVRRLTPLECERLQGFPDGWTDIGEWVDTKGKKHKAADSPRYKALGNSIAIPVFKFIIKRLCACYERDATMASLFDGIGGFPYIWEQINGKGSCLWASEIEEFPIAVTKLRFGGADNG